MKKKIIAYTRVSTGDQKADMQRDGIQAWLDAKSVAPGDVVWIADVESAARAERPGLGRTEDLIFDGAVDQIVVWKLDRLARSQREGIDLLHRWCEAGVGIVSLTERLDLSGATGRLVAGLMFGLAEIECEFIRERQRAGIEAAKKRGVYKGGKAGTFKASPKRALALRQQGLRTGEIARALGVTPITVRRYLRATAAPAA